MGGLEGSQQSPGGLDGDPAVRHGTPARGAILTAGERQDSR